ncbi:MAG: AAA domain-containing protein [Candidatus Omnitrophica bacterium]|nr:AAA domain-containing protein [Candidatus Omnitrophota bacterium]MDD5670518.1 AAA domain-containing protein [Candidatus Omnitrophota bacterium]
MIKPKRYAIDEKEIVDKHFALLNKLLQQEEKSDGARFKSEVLDKAPEDQERGGKALFRLVLVESHFNPSGQRLLSFSLQSGRWLPRYSLQVGDVVRLSGFQTPQTECPVGTVYEKNRLKITVAFSTHLPGWVGHEQTYNLNVAQNRTTYDRMYEAVREVGHARHSRLSYIRDVSLGLRKVRFRDPVRPEQIEFFDQSLNEHQRKAVCMAMEADDTMVIHGPPGTGKTRVLVEVIRQARKKDESVLVSAPSNAACDHLVDCLVAAGVPVTRLGNPARVTEAIREHTLSFQLARHPFAKMIEEHEFRLEQLARQKERRQDRRVMSWEEKGAMRDEVRAIRDDIRNLKAQIFSQVWNVSDVVVATHTVCGDAILKSRTFDWVIIDEATQGIEPSTWIPASRLGRLILAGDHCQLPPTVLSPRTGPMSLHVTLFERMHRALGAESKIRLEIQYRMNEKIMAFASQEFYEGRLVADPGIRDRLLTDLAGVQNNPETVSPIVFLDTAGLGYEEKPEAGTGSRFNAEEANLVLKEFQLLLEAGVPAGEIAIISPYSAQVKLLSNLLTEKEEGPEKVDGPEIDSIDAFQGREKEVVIVSLVRSNLTGQLGFLTDTRRMNVAMTRARRKLIVIGDSATISSLPFYTDFIRYVESVRGYRSAWEYVQ